MTYETHEQLCKNHRKKSGESIIVHRLIQDLQFKRLDLYNFLSSTFPQFKQNNSPFTQKPIVTIVTLTPCFETRLPQLPHFHKLSWKRLKRRTASWYSRSKTFIGCEGIPVRRLQAAGLDLKRPCYTTHHRKLRPVICCEFLRLEKKNRKCWYMFVGHTQVGMIIHGLGGTSNYQMMMEIMVTLPPRSKACVFLVAQQPHWPSTW